MASKAKPDVTFYPADNVAAGKPSGKSQLHASRAQFDKPASTPAVAASIQSEVSSSSSEARQQQKQQQVKGVVQAATSVAAPIAGHLGSRHRVTHGQLIKLLDVKGSSHSNAQKRTVRPSSSRI
jgi:biotin carboxyl carrier protein